jgi:lipid-binding SYLF domain-containing protein
MIPHYIALPRCEWPWLAQYLAGNADLSHIVQTSRMTDGGDVVVRNGKLGNDRLGIFDYSVRVCPIAREFLL